MAPGSLKSLRLALMAVFLAGAPVTYAAMFKWIDEEGSVTYSNQPPSDPAKVKELTKIEEPAQPPKPEAAVAKPEPPAAPQSEPAIAKPEAPAPGTVTVMPDAPAPKPETVTAKPEPPAPRPEVVIIKPQTPGASTEIIMVNPAPPRPTTDLSGALPAPDPEAPRRVIPRPTHTEAVQDPCLTSSDRNCPQRYSKHYSGYGGFSTTPRPQVAAGGTSGAGAVGSVAGGKSTVAPPNWVAPVSPAKPAARGSRYSKTPAATSTSEVR